MGWLYLRFAAINVENRGNGGTLGECQISAYKIAKCFARFEKQKKKKQKKKQKKPKQKQKGIHNFLF